MLQPHTPQTCDDDSGYEEKQRAIVLVRKQRAPAHAPPLGARRLCHRCCCGFSKRQQRCGAYPGRGWCVGMASGCGVAHVRPPAPGARAAGSHACPFDSMQLAWHSFTLAFSSSSALPVRAFRALQRQESACSDFHPRARQLAEIAHHARPDAACSCSRIHGRRGRRTPHAQRCAVAGRRCCRQQRAAWHRCQQQQRQHQRQHQLLGALAAAI